MITFKSFINNISYKFLYLFLSSLAICAMETEPDEGKRNNSQPKQKSYFDFVNEYKDLFLDEGQKLYLEEGCEETARKNNAELREQQGEKTKTMLLTGSLNKNEWQCIRHAYPGNEIPTEESLIVRDRQDILLAEAAAKIKREIQYYDKLQQETAAIIQEKFRESNETEARIAEAKKKYNAFQAILNNELLENHEQQRRYSQTIKDISEKTLHPQMKTCIEEMFKLTDIYDEEDKQQAINKFQHLIKEKEEKKSAIKDDIEEDKHKFLDFIMSQTNLIKEFEFSIQEKKEALNNIEAIHNEKIRKLNQQLDFIKQNIYFLCPNQRPRSILHGELSDASSLGQGITIGIIDFFPTDLSARPHQLTTSEKVINPTFNGSEDSTGDGLENVRKALGFSPKTPGEDGLHGVSVASIAASSDVYNYSLPVGQASGAHIEYLDHQKLTSFNEVSTSFVFPESISQGEDRIKAHSAFLNTLPFFEKGKLYPVTNWLQEKSVEPVSPEAAEKVTSLNNIFESPILKTQAKVVNISASASSNRYAKGLQCDPECDLESFIQYKALADMNILIVSTLGNDGIYLATSEGYLMKRALARAKTTCSKFILVGSLMEDGLTIASHSNQPGDDTHLQERTLFALGTNVPCLCLDTNTYVKESGTSFAAPHVSGAAAIVMSQFPLLSAEQVSECLLMGATPIFIGVDGLPQELPNCTNHTALDQSSEVKKLILLSRKKYGMGCLNISNALKLAEEASK